MIEYIPGTGKPVPLQDETYPWLPSLYLGHSSMSHEQVQAKDDRWARKKARDKAGATSEVAQSLI